MDNFADIKNRMLLNRSILARGYPRGGGGSNSRHPKKTPADQASAFFWMRKDRCLVRHLLCRLGSVHVRTARSNRRPLLGELRVGIGWFIPQPRLHAVEIVDDLAVLDRHLADELLV